MMKNSAAHLKVHEWAVVVIAIGAILATGTYGYITSSYPTTQDDTKGTPFVTETITVTVEGAVQYPGTYTVKRGTLMKDAIAMAQPLDNADTRRVKNNSKVRNRQKIKVKTLL
ncbi:MAG: hypothetical protein HN411_02780 [Waddliaceae bacterium]|jgi:hypothetical protein|nr:hypothetical protein [Waddliaceae bacterium]MBT3578661.1 hypothetical protein [Waddliaceae bacterium]MBT4445380.1 hypothetical protein [Waddliaceae bacterium]MBT6928352.1 hypothetical protein [Waddliaceae bacterium]MBT7265038.1 hypothetical protein [Waddliaceae bacterium]